MSTLPSIQVSASSRTELVALREVVNHLCITMQLRGPDKQMRVEHKGPTMKLANQPSTKKNAVQACLPLLLLLYLLLLLLLLLCCLASFN
jgi:hypothetical protein